MKAARAHNLLAAFAVSWVSTSNGQEVPPNITKEDLAKDNKLFLRLVTLAD